ncbi:MAG: CatB-related O-acetyltransferase [Candidatus Symbiothrix sp.]|jgi:virginiamycin A acetyltransferase|nr:CatB-related O-acetyltransferase [Candidatus Symbiothrix sp.]
MGSKIYDLDIVLATIKKAVKKILVLSGYEIRKKRPAPTVKQHINFEYLEEEPLIYKSDVGKNVKIGKRTMIIRSAIDGNNISIGNNTSINAHTEIHNSAENQIVIGSFCSIAPYCNIFGHNHNHHAITTYYIRQRIFKETGSDVVSKGDTIIGNDVWIGTQSVIVSGIKIGDGAVIAANSTVTSDIPPYAIVGGSPAKIIKYRFSDDIIKKLLELQWWHWDIEKIKRNKNLFYGDLTLEKLNNIVE